MKSRLERPDNKPFTDFRNLDRRDNVLYGLRMAPQVSVTPENFFTKYAEMFALGPDDTMTDYRESTDHEGLRRIAFSHFYKGIRVFGDDFVLLSKQHVVAGLGRITPHLNVDVSKSLSSQDARSTALDNVASRFGMRRALLEGNSECEEYLGILAHSLAYRCIVNATKAALCEAVDIDARTGTVLASRSLLVGAIGSCVGTSVYNGNVIFDAEIEDATEVSILTNDRTEVLDCGETDLQTKAVI